MDSIHSYEASNTMIESSERYTRISLETVIKACFGRQARLCTHSAERVTVGELVTFLAAKSKFMPSEEGFSTDQSKTCRH